MIIKVEEIKIKGKKFMYCNVVNHKKFNEVYKEIQTYYGTYGVGLNLKQIKDGLTMKEYNKMTDIEKEKLYKTVDEFNAKYDKPKQLNKKFNTKIFSKETLLKMNYEELKKIINNSVASCLVVTNYSQEK